ncbi:MAG TPA: TonB-dependent receptor plug domain-containing protein, partial [Polyangiaceae bacterium]
APSASPAPPRSPPAPSAPPASVTPVEEVNVRGKRAEIAETQLGGAEVRQLPGAFGDAFRAIEALPGVTPIVSGLPFFFVRGAPPGDVGYFIDGVRVPLLYHLALGPSVIHPGLIDHVDFYPGGYPARFGRYAGGILDGETIPPATHAHGEANVRLFDAGALAEAPADEGRLTALVAGRYSYTAALVQLFAKDTRVGYWDYQTRVEYRLTPRDRVSFFLFGSFDEIDNRDRQDVFDGQGNVTQTVGVFYPVFKTEFHRLDLRYDHDTARGHLRLAATLGVEDSLAGSSATQHTSVVAHSLGLRSEGDERLGAELKLRYGADVDLYHYALDTGASSMLDVQSLYPTRNDVMVGAYTDVIWKASDRVEIVPGLRLDAFTSRLASPAAALEPSNDRTAGLPGALSNATATIGVDPRIATRVVTSRRVTWVTTFGVSHQPPSLFVPIPGLTLGRLNSGLQTSIQTSQGIELALPLDVTLTTTGFLHNYLGLTDATATCLGNGDNLSQGANDCLAERVRGRAFGVELLARRDLTKRFTGWLSYTLSRTTRETRGLIVAPQSFPSPGPGPSGVPVQSQSLQEIPSEFDRTHVLNVIGALDLGKNWRAGARLVFYTGRPYSPEIQGVPIPPFNSLRLPAFYRIDVRLEKRWRAFGDGSLAFVIEGMNVTLNKEAIDVTCDSSGSLRPFRLDKCSPEFIGPVSVPSIGFEGSI